MCERPTIECHLYNPKKHFVLVHGKWNCLRKMGSSPNDTEINHFHIFFLILLSIYRLRQWWWIRYGKLFGKIRKNENK